MIQLIRALAITTALLLQGCASSPPLEARHQPSGLNSSFYGDHFPFAEYVANTRAMIAKARADATPAELEKVLAGNAPFELKPAASCPQGKGKPYQRGVLLTHGLTDSPYFMRHLAAFFQDNCFRVMALLLPGHGTRPGDLLEVRWEDWAKAEAYGLKAVAAEADEVYLAGFSTGGALSVYQGVDDPRVRGLFLFSPAFKVSSMAALANLHKPYSWAIPSAKWIDILADKDIYKYESFTKNAAAEIYGLTRALESRLQDKEIKVPVFAVLSQDDTSVASAATLRFMARATHPASRTVLYTTEPNTRPADLPAEKIELINSVLPEQKILSAAHTSIVLPMDDPHYGTDGTYSNCLHYLPKEMPKFEACTNRPKDALQGEITENNLNKGVMRRLMFNPHFGALKVSMKRFIDQLP